MKVACIGPCKAMVFLQLEEKDASTEFNICKFYPVVDLALAYSEVTLYVREMYI
jgi:hypothetical protein